MTLMKTIQKMSCICIQRIKLLQSGNRKSTALYVLPDKLYTIEADDKITDNCKYLLETFQAAQN